MAVNTIKVNITGRWLIPGVNKYPPVYNYDATEALVRRLIHFENWRLWEAETGRLINKDNVDEFFTTSPSPSPSPGPSSEGVVWTVLE